MKRSLVVSVLLTFVVLLLCGLAAAPAIAAVSFAAKADFAVGDAPCSVVVADLNRDGSRDVATADFLAATVSVLPGDGYGRLTALILGLRASGSPSRRSAEAEDALRVAPSARRFK